MQGRVDYNAGVVQVGDLSWPFDLDLSKGVASLEIGDQHYAVRPLLWREKVTLARFAHLGLAFVQQHFLRLSLAGMVPPTSEAALAALRALALWVNAPDESQPGVPLDPELLGSVALKVCRAAGLRPADLDERSAAEVELLWQAIDRADQTVAPYRPILDPTLMGEADDGQVRILVLPDPSPKEPTGVTQSDRIVQSQNVYPKSPSDATQDLNNVAQQAARLALGREATPSTEQDAEAIGKARTDANRELPASTLSTTSTLPTTPISLGTPVLPKPGAGTSLSKAVASAGVANTFRIFYPKAIVQDEPDGDNEPIARPTAQQPYDRLSTPVNGTGASPGAVPMAVRSSMTGERTVERAAPKGMPVVTNVMPPSSLPAQEGQQELSPPIEWGILLDELNERLEQAADDLGIDLEG